MSKEDIINKILECETLEEINNILDKLHPSDAYDIIMSTEREYRHIINKYRPAASDEPIATTYKEIYQTYQDIRLNAKKSYDHDMTVAKMIDVDKAVSKAYTILLRMISEVNKVVSKQCDAINKIEKHLGLEETVFYKEDDANGTAKLLNEQGSTNDNITS